jgi:PAS domain S-box-containing protein
VVLTLTDITPVKQAELNQRSLAMHLEQRVQARTAELETEIRERHRVERALRESEQKLSALVDDAPVGIVQTDLHDGRFLMVNPRFCAMTGYGETELLGRPFAEITPPEDRVDNLEALVRLGRGKVPGYQTEKRYIRKDGTPIWADLKVILVRDPQGHPLHTLGVISDITSASGCRRSWTSTSPSCIRAQFHRCHPEYRGHLDHGGRYRRAAGSIQRRLQ